MSHCSKSSGHFIPSPEATEHSGLYCGRSPRIMTDIPSNAKTNLSSISFVKGVCILLRVKSHSTLWQHVFWAVVHLRCTNYFTIIYYSRKQVISSQDEHKHVVLQQNLTDRITTFVKKRHYLVENLTFSNSLVDSRLSSKVDTPRQLFDPPSGAMKLTGSITSPLVIAVLNMGSKQKIILLLLYHVRLPPLVNSQYGMCTIHIVSLPI